MHASFPLTESVYLLFALGTIGFAYLIKGFTGFGPALISIPILSIFYPPAQVIYLATFLDIIAGAYLLKEVYRLIDWKFVLTVLLFFLPGAYYGAHLLFHLELTLLKKLLGLAILFFVGLIWLNTLPSFKMKHPKRSLKITISLSFLAGIGGGLFGISGPLLVIYFKLLFKKALFRAQLIAIFFFGALWRLLLYHQIGLQVQWTTLQLLLFVGFMVFGLFTGKKLQLRVNHQTFDRLVGLVLLLPGLRLLFF